MTDPSRYEGLDAWLATVAEYAPRLREAGVLDLHLPDGGAIHLAPAEVRASTATTPAVAPPRDLLNPLDDPATFGGQLPGYDLGALERGEV